MADIVLASSSPRRAERFASAGVRHKIVKPEPDAPIPPGMCAAELEVQLLARKKATSVLKQTAPLTYVIAADTTVVAPDVKQPFGKPQGDDDARRMLMSLRGKRHTVFTGICVLVAGSEREAIGVSSTVVKMRSITDDEINAYIASGGCFDKAGAYSIADTDFVEAVNGRVDTVAGLDLTLAFRLLTEAGYPDPLPQPADMAIAQNRDARRPLMPMRPARV